MHKALFAIEIEMRKGFRDFEIQMDHWILTEQFRLKFRKKKRTCQQVNFYIPE